MIKLQSHVMFVLHDTRIKPSNVKKKKNTKCDKKTVTCDVDTTQMRMKPSNVRKK